MTHQHSPTVKADRATRRALSANPRLIAALAPIAAFAWPFLFLFPYVFPARGRFLGIGNDFEILYFSYKAYLLDSLARLDIPWWSPSEAAGFPFYASPFSQTFYPLNVPLSVYYAFANGYQLIDHQRYAVLGVAIFTLGLFCWLRSLRFEVRTALAAAMIMGVSFKVTEILRFPNALHTAAWYPWILWAMTRLAASESRTSLTANGALLAGASICMVTGGYPYYVIYSPWLFAPYLLVLLVPRWSRALLEREPARLRRVLPALTAAGFVVAAICGPLIYKTSALMQQTTDRGGESFEYSTSHVFNYQDTIGSWLFPPASQVEGWYYFGIINVMLILLAVARRPRNPLPWFLLAWLALITYVTYGKSSYLFTLLWTYVPTFSSLRVWARMNIILVPILAWLVAIAYQQFESLVAGRNLEPQRSRWNWRPLVLLCVIAGAILMTQLHVRGERWLDEYWVQYYVGGIELNGTISALLEYLEGWGLRAEMTSAQMIAAAERASIIATVLSFLGLGTLLILAQRVRIASARLPRIALTAIVAIAALDLWIVGPWVWASAALPVSPRAPYQIDERNAQSFTVPRIDSGGFAPSGPFRVGVLENWYFERYVDFLGQGKREPEALKELLGMVDGRKVWFSERIDHASIQAFLDDARRFSGVERVTAYTGDEISISVRAPANGYLSFIDNWDPDWTAAVDATAVPIERLFGTFKSVPVRTGARQVDFVYRPFGFWP